MISFFYDKSGKIKLKVLLYTLLTNMSKKHYHWMIETYDDDSKKISDKLYYNLKDINNDYPEMGTTSIRLYSQKYSKETPPYKGKCKYKYIKIIKLM